MPKTNTDYWNEKFRRNVERDRKTKNKLEKDGWKVIVIWECETRNEDSIENFFRENLPS